MNVFQNVTKGSFVKGTSILIVLAGAAGADFTNWGTFGIFLTGIPLWCFSLLASVGGILFFLWPMIFGSEPEVPMELGAKKTERMLFLYLRPFELDARNILQLIVGASAGALVYTDLVYGNWWVISFLPLVVNISKEQAFKDAFAPLGEFIAFGKPWERLQPIGASRIYAGDDWMQQVSGYLTQARLVIVRPGRSKSIRQEITTVLEVVPPERILFYLRFRGRKKKREAAYADFRSLCQKKCPKLPEHLGTWPYLTFDASWNPYFIREANRPTELVRQFLSRSGDIWTDRWQPIFNALNLEMPARADGLLYKFLTIGSRLIVFFALGIAGLATCVALARVVSAFLLYLLYLLIQR